MPECPSCHRDVRSVAPDPWCHDCGGRFSELGAAQPGVAVPVKREDDRPEKQIQLAIRQVLQLYPVTVYDTSQPFKAAITPGLPDLIVFGFGRVTFAEIKRADGALTPAQEIFRDLCFENGVPWECWRHEEDAIRWATEAMDRAA